MAQETWQLTGSGPDNYERYQVPSIFEPLARLFLERVALHPGQHVLDVACGTGIVARLAAPLLGPGGSIVGLDLNEKMLDVARRHSPTGGATVAWQQGDVTAMAFPEDAFDVVLCQQGLQFFPDKSGALREMRRVLKPAGLLGICVWRGVEHSPLHLAAAASLKERVSAEAAQRVQAPFGLGDRDVLLEHIGAAGFRDVEIQTATIMRRLLAPEISVPGFLGSTPVGPEIAALDQATRDGIVADVAQALSQYRDGNGMTVPQSTYVIRARK